MNKIFLFLVLFCCSGYSVNALKVQRLRMDSAQTASNPFRVVVSDSGSDTLEWLSIDSIVGSDSVRASHKSDTANVARKSLLTTHGVTPGYHPKAATDSTFTNSHISENGDTTKVAYNGAVSDTFLYSFSPTSSVYSGCSAPNGDCYFAIQYGTAPGFYIQVGGIGSLTRVTAFPEGSSIPAMTSDPSGNIYAVRYCSAPGCWVYRRAGGTGNFDTLTNARKMWSALSCDKSGVLYGATYGDTIYTSSDQGATWVFFQKISPIKHISNVLPNGDLLLIGGSYDNAPTYYSRPDVYRKTPAGNAFYALGWHSVDYWATSGADTSGVIYLSTGTASGTYRSMDNLQSLRKIQGKFFAGGFVPRINGSIYGLANSQVWLKTSESIKTVFAVLGGNTKLAGKVEIGNVYTTATPAYLLAQNPAPDNEIKKIAVASLYGTIPHNVTPGQIPMSNGATTFRNTGTTVDSATGDIHAYGKIIVGDTAYPGVTASIEAHGNSADVDKDSIVVNVSAAPNGQATRGAAFRAAGNEASGMHGNAVMEAGDSGDALIGGQNILIHVDHPADTSALGVSQFKADVKIGRDSVLIDDINRVAIYLGRDIDSSCGLIYGGKGASSTMATIKLGNNTSNKTTISADTVRIIDRLEAILVTSTLGVIDTIDVGLMRIGGGSNIVDMHRRSDTLVIKLSATDSLCFKAVAP